MKKLIFLFALSGILFIACDKEDVTPPTPESEPYDVNVDIIRPEAASNNTFQIPIGIEVQFTRDNNELIHSILIEVYDDNGSLVSTLLDEVVGAEGTYTYNNDQGFNPGVKGEYTLRASSSDGDGNSTDPVETNFFAQ